jgi:hypothetical protein
MKVEKKSVATTFQSVQVVLTLETPAELEEFQQMLRDARYGIGEDEDETAGKGNDKPHDQMTAELLNTVGWPWSKKD